MYHQCKSLVINSAKLALSIHCYRGKVQAKMITCLIDGVYTLQPIQEIESENQWNMFCGTQISPREIKSSRDQD